MSLLKVFTLQSSLRDQAAFSPLRRLRTEYIRDSPNLAVGLFCAIITCILTTILHPFSLVAYWYYFIFWAGFMFLLDREQQRWFTHAYFVNGLLTAIFVAIQIYNFPDSYGTTSPNGSQTDDSYFFSLLADEIPSNMETRASYFLYESTFPTLIKALTFFRVTHPLDVLYFLSGIAGLVCVYARQLTMQIAASDSRAAKAAYSLCLLCPLFLMNGGAVLIRDTFAGALFLMSLCFIYRARYFTAIICIGMHYALRPGTALLVLPVYGVIYFSEIRTAFTDSRLRTRAFIIGFGALAVLAGLYVMRDEISFLLEENTVIIAKLSREGMIDNYISLGGQGTFVWVQQQSIPVKLSLAGPYILLNPFLTLSGFSNPIGFDLRTFLMGIIYPLFIFGVHAMALSSLTVRVAFSDRIWLMFGAFLLGCTLIGVFSLESRHKVVLQPLYYILAAIGIYRASPSQKLFGYALSAGWFLTQIGFAFVASRKAGYFGI
jgi:hypothetical protein